MEGRERAGRAYRPLGQGIIDQQLTLALPEHGVALLILADWGLAVLTSTERRDMLEILEDRHGRGSTIVTSQFTVEHWHDAIGDPTLADAILDRLVHNVHRLPLAGESMRKRAAAMKPLVPTGRA